jgi:branched-subunit amino acid permease
MLRFSSTYPAPGNYGEVFIAAAAVEECLSTAIGLLHDALDDRVQ